ncbi:MAG TPA: BamA/TamA family outer membrane protein [Rhizomicrobium sp.]|nr:BamA/TamA family outer membrane protein [Rhizomicrobium sp.]
MLLVITLFSTLVAHASDSLSYAATVSSTDQSDLDAALSASSELIALADRGPVAPFSLIERARSDIPRLQTALDSFGYYQNSVTITIEGRALDDPNLAAELDILPADRPARIEIGIKKGPLYRIGAIDITGTISDAQRKVLGLARGDAAIASQILGARIKLLDTLHTEGYALAKVEGPLATADDENQRIDIAFTVERGPSVEIGTIAFHGLISVSEDALRGALAVKPGDRYDPARIETSRQTLMGLGVFSTVTVQEADHLGADGRLPLTFSVVERSKHVVNLGGAYSTDLGISMSATWSDRNLLGNAEQLNLTAAANGLGTASVGVGYNLTAQYVEPLFFWADQSLELDLSDVKQDLVAYSQQAETGAAYIHDTFSTLWKASAGLFLTNDNVEQEGASQLYQLVALPLSLNYDDTGLHDLLQDTTHGMRAFLAAMPTHAFGASNLSFVVLQASGSTYFDLSGDGRSVFALRGLAAEILGGSNISLPPDRRLYLGGSGTVRGFAYQTIGPLFPDGRPIGAKAIDAGTVELRQRFGESWGAAAFVDAGQTSASGALFKGPVRIGAGAGLRYYTDIGAVRIDFAVPVTPVPGGDAFEFYIGIGQAF